MWNTYKTTRKRSTVNQRNDILFKEETLHKYIYNTQIFNARSKTDVTSAVYRVRSKSKDNNKKETKTENRSA